MVRLEEHLFILVLESVVVIVCWPLVELGTITPSQGAVIAAGALFAGWLIERFRKKARRFRDH
jgi:hypothetical protein